MRHCAEFPRDLLPIGEESENELRRLLYEAVQDLRWKDAVAKEAPARVLGTLLVFCYFRGLYSSSEIALLARTDADLQYICMRSLPGSNELRIFRRENRALIEHALATLLRLLSASRQEVLPGTPLTEARERVNRAVKCDCFEMDV